MAMREVIVAARPNAIAMVASMDTESILASADEASLQGKRY